MGGADLIHGHCAYPDGFAATRFANQARLPSVLTLWGSDVLVHGAMRLDRWFVSSALRRARAVIAVSEQLGDRAISLGADESRVHVIPPGVPYRPIRPYDETRAVLRIEPAEVVIVWIGGLVSVKQPLEAISAFDAIALPQSRLVMIGDGPLRRELQAAIRNSRSADRISIMGHLDREEVWRWQCAADLILNSSRSEGTPLAVLEAMGAGTRVAAYPLPGIAAAVGAANGGVIADSATPNALADAAIRALTANDHRHSLATNARDRFSIERSAASIDDVYRSLS